ncbi:MAG: septum site-determining protein MinC, partial [Methylococcales bacterium]|nr:septum site-determining protein MinC [Methylococcales bacterium]
LRGRALAGVNGDESARVFCQSLNAELVSVAGHYKVNEDLSQAVRGRPTQVFLEGDKLRISLLQA